MSEDYWDGATWIYHAQITNGAGGGGDITATVVPDAGHEVEILYGGITNGDSTGRSGRGFIQDPGGNTLGEVFSQTINAGVTGYFMNSGDTTAKIGSGARVILSGTMQLQLTLVSVAQNQDAIFALTCRIRGDPPTVTEAGNDTPTITIDTEQVV